ncbi:MAG: hypothetical protein MK289_00220 [Trichodesmium sp. ALOHA_ZT_67]|nr:hypothetical protein [Trichodesmium sp. ALOHA_ZT_67]
MTNFIFKICKILLQNRLKKIFVSDGIINKKYLKKNSSLFDFISKNEIPAVALFLVAS